MVTIVKFISLVVAIWFSIVNFGRMKYGQEVSSQNFAVQSVSIAVFVFIQFNLF